MELCYVTECDFFSVHMYIKYWDNIFYVNYISITLEQKKMLVSAHKTKPRKEERETEITQNLGKKKKKKKSQVAKQKPSVEAHLANYHVLFGLQNLINNCFKLVAGFWKSNGFTLLLGMYAHE